MKLSRSVFVFSAFFMTLICKSVWSDIISIPGPQSKEDVSQNYYATILQLALDESKTAEYKLNQVALDNLTHGRSLQLLEQNQIDVFWAGTSIERESKFIAIRIPLMRGLLGYRVSIIHSENLKSFSNISEHGLKLKVACQGQHWPDRQILQANDFNTASVARFDLMFKMVNAGRCDYFPRAIFEGYGELAMAQENMPQLVMFDDLILSYPFPIYFFTNRKSTKLAQQIEQGLLATISNGKFENVMRKHPVTSHLFPLSKWDNKHYIRLVNPYLPKDTDVNNEQLWWRLPKG